MLGSEWEQAWREHCKTNPSNGEELYRSATELNENEHIIRTVDEGSASLYPRHHVSLLCHELYRLVANGDRPKPPPLHDIGENNEDGDQECRVVDRYEASDGTTRYMVEMVNIYDHDDEDSTVIDVEEVLFYLPREALYFEDAAYSRDHSMPWTYVYFSEKIVAISSILDSDQADRLTMHNLHLFAFLYFLTMLGITDSDMN